MGFMDRMKKAAEGVQAQTSKVGIGASADSTMSALSGESLRLIVRSAESASLL